MARALYSDYGFEPEDPYAEVHDDFYAGEPICAPSRLRYGRGRALLRALLFIAFVSGAGYGYLKAPESWRSWAADHAAAMWTSLASNVSTHSEGSEQAAAPPVVKAPPPVIAEREVVEAPGAAAGTPVEPKTAALAPADVAADDRLNDEPAAAEPLPPPTVDPADPFQKRALAAGLHPELSRAVLSRLTEADFKNATVAIQTALAETPDDGVYEWPKKAQKKQALFEVRFVKGVAADCRRYVVTVTLERWATTARAMEKCGADLPKRKFAKAAG